jgi:hypothetical protein
MVAAASLRAQDIWHKRLKCNTEIYEKALRTLPNNHVTTWRELQEWRDAEPLADTDPEAGASHVIGCLD